MATTVNALKRLKDRSPEKLDAGVGSFVGDAFQTQTNSIAMDGSTENMAHRTNASELNSGEWTIMISLKRTGAFSKNGQLVFFHGAGYSETCIFSTATGSDQMIVSINQTDASTGHRDTISDMFTDDVWVHIVVTHDGAGDVSICYKDASVEYTNSSSKTFGAIDKQMYHHGDGFNGVIHQTAWWSEVLDADAVTAIYNSGDPAAFDLNEDSGNYDNSDTLQLWFRHAHDDTSTTTMLKNFSAIGPIFNLDDNSSNISTADAVADAP